MDITWAMTILLGGLLIVRSIFNSADAHKGRKYDREDAAKHREYRERREARYKNDGGRNGGYDDY
jgi:hypothetical protein